jgi:hypothetical protein
MLLTFTALQQVYGEKTMSRMQAFVWVKGFQFRRETLQMAKLSGHLTASRTDPNVEKNDKW